MQKKGLLQSIWDHVGVVPRLGLVPQKHLPRFRWSTLEEDRSRAVFPRIQGRLLDIGAGPNLLVNRYGDGVGVDVVDWGGGVKVVENTAELPFEAESFDTITILAALNHIPYREAVLREARRVVRPSGRLIVTMIDPILGELGHKIWWHDEHHQRGGMEEGEVGGMWNADIIRICGEAGWRLTHRERFVYWLNNLLLFEPESDPTPE